MVSAIIEKKEQKMADKKAKIKKLNTPFGVLATMQCAHLGKVLAIMGIACAILQIIACLSMIFVPIIHLFAWVFVIMLLGIPLLFDWGWALLETTAVEGLVEIVRSITGTLSVISIVLCVIAIIFMLAERNKKYGLITTCIIILIIALLISLMGASS